MPESIVSLLFILGQTNESMPFLPSHRSYATTHCGGRLSVLSLKRASDLSDRERIFKDGRIRQGQMRSGYRNRSGSCRLISGGPLLLP